MKRSKCAAEQVAFAPQYAGVAMLANHPDAAEAQPAMDALLRWVYER